MTPADAAELLTLCAAFDRRTIGEADARAWAFALRNIPLDDDTRAAVADHYAHTEKWITPAHVKQIRARTRDTRLGAAHPVYDGTPDETGAEFTVRRREQLAAAAEGTLPARTITQALDAAPPRELLALAAGVGRPVDDEPRPYITEQRRAEVRAPLSGNRAALVELAVACPTETCRAGARHLCRRSGGIELRGTVHGRRRDAYAVQFATCPECGAPAGQHCAAPEPHSARIRTAREIAA
ncbi:hypothetical protein ACIBCO_36230 [Streptomyces violascens]|uniref:hypothetical protein n=1 Tax=Streptomyces violascens TaxID=67381 RepID=UPI0037B01976